MSDTIAAIATAPGEAGIGVVRVSGPLSYDIMKKLFHTFGTAPAEFEPRHAYFGKFCGDEGKEIDEVICIFMKAPHTYTCEDVLEIQGHGSPVSLKLILRAVIKCGARLAEPGEFTKLAFMNGRIDLSQAEAVMDLISAKTDVPLGIAVKQLSGDLSSEIENIRSNVRDILAQITVNIDFPDEDIEQEEYTKLIEDTEKEKSRVENLYRSGDSGRIARDGIKVAIAGRPNVGKSSLMNALLGEDRAIVTDIPGTTRDTIVEEASFSGIPIILTDTAGIRETSDKVEKIGVDRARDQIHKADLIVLVIDGSRPLESEDEKIIASVKKVLDNGSGRVLAVINKNDLGMEVSESDIKSEIPQAEIVTTSLINLGGEKPVTDAIERMASEGEIKSDMGNIVINERHLDALRRALSEMNDTIDGLKEGQPLELVEVSLHNAYDELGEIIGEAAGDEILDDVFSRFCLGK